MAVGCSLGLKERGGLGGPVATGSAEGGGGAPADGGHRRRDLSRKEKARRQEDRREVTRQGLGRVTRLSPRCS